MATVVTGLACSLSLQSAAYLQGLNAAAMATTTAATKMQRAFNQTAVATNQTTAAMERQAVVAKNAAAQTGQSFLQMGRSVTAVANSWKALGGLFAIGLIAEGIRAAASFSDAWQTAGNKIAAASEISGQSARSLSQLNKIATDTRSPIEDIGDLYSKLLRTTAGVAKSELEVATATDTVAKAFKAGGASTLEQVNGIRQLAQALGSGILQGDELRSIRENAPLLAKAIADELGTTVAGLKKIGAEGKITAEIIFKAILHSKGEIDAAFEATAPTIADANTIIENSFEELVGAVNKASGASTKYYGVAKFLSDGFKEMAEAIAPVVVNLKSVLGASFQTVHALEPLPDVLEDITVTSTSGSQQLFTYASALKDVVAAKGLMDATSGFQPTNPDSMFTTGLADKPHGMGLYGPEQSLDFEGIAKRATQAESAVAKLKSTGHDWATQVEVTDAGKLQADAYSHLAEYVKQTETPFEKYKRTLAEVAVLERDGALTAEQAFRERASSSLTFANTALGAASAMSGALTQLFKNNKAVAIANAVINTAEAITSALKNPPGPPFSYVYAAAAAVAGAAQIASIVSTNPGSGAKTPSVKGGGGKTAKASSAAPAAAGDASTTSGKTQTSVNITLEGQGGFSGDQVRNLIAEINKAVGDGATLKVS